jgi:hypothetical protein
MYKFKAIKTLSQLLEQEKIPHEMTGYRGGFVIAYPSLLTEEMVCSVMQNVESQGGTYELLEMKWPVRGGKKSLGEVHGYLTAVEVFNRIKRDWEKGVKK